MSRRRRSCLAPWQVRGPVGRWGCPRHAAVQSNRACPLPPCPAAGASSAALTWPLEVTRRRMMAGMSTARFWGCSIRKQPSPPPSSPLPLDKQKKPEKKSQKNCASSPPAAVLPPLAALRLRRPRAHCRAGGGQHGGGAGWNCAAGGRGRSLQRSRAGPRQAGKLWSRRRWVERYSRPGDAPAAPATCRGPSGAAAAPMYEHDPGARALPAGAADGGDVCCVRGEAEGVVSGGGGGL